MTGPVISGLIFSALIIFLCLFRPEAGRIFLGFFFILMGLGVNLSFIISQPYFVYEYGMSAWLPLYRTLTESIIGMNPVLFGVLLIIFEVSVGLMLLGKGKWTKAGILLASLFILILIPIYLSQIAWALNIPVLLMLLKRDFDRNVFEVIKRKKSA